MGDRPGHLITTRRELVVASGALAAGFAVTNPAYARLQPRTKGVGRGQFLDGVASGEPTESAVTFWSRVTTANQRSAAKLIVAKDQGMEKVIATVVVPTSSGVDHTVKARIGGLKPSQHYWYAWQTRDDVSPIGRTKTAPTADSNQPVTIGYSSCQNYPVGFFNAHGDAAKIDEIDIYAFLGDYYYEYDGESNEDIGGRVNRGTPDPASTDLTSYRSKLKLYRGDSQLRELHRMHPVVHVWDDHEVADNYTDGKPSPSALQRAAGYRASNEWLPRVAVPGDRNRLYRSLRYGKNAELFMLDQRQYRTPGVPGTTLLGRAQMDWLKGGLASSSAKWKLIGNPDMITPLGVSPSGEAGLIFNKDQWDGYPAERTELLSWISDKKINDVAFLTGDIHLYMANNVMHNGRPVATEYIGGSVTSSAVPESLNGVAASILQGINPWIKYFDGARHGWSIARVSDSVMNVEYRSSDIRVAGAPSTTLAAFTQAAGANQIGQQTAGKRGGLEFAQTLGEDPADAAALPGSNLARRRAKVQRAAHKDLKRRAKKATGKRSK